MALAGTEISITPVGWAFGIVSLVCLLLRPRWLLPLLVVAAAMHLPAVAVISVGPGLTTLGIPPWLLVGSACCLQWVRDMLANGSQFWTPNQYYVANLRWCGFMLAAAASAAILPLVFTGVPVFWLGNTLGFDAPLTPLKWSATNGAQIVNSSLISLLFLYAGLESRHPGVEKRIIVGFALAFTASLSLGIAQRAMIRHLIEPWFWWEESINPGYAYGTGYFIDIPRAPWPFSEPSYASVWCSALAVGGLALLLYRGKAAVGVVCLALGVAGMANALGVTGFASFLLAAAMLLALRFARFFGRETAESKKRIRLILMSGVLALVVTMMGLIVNSEQVRHVAHRASGALVEKMERETNADHPLAYRLRSNLHALELIEVTRGLGVGVGSNRASSYLAGLASNMGLMGLAAFLLFTARHLRELAKRKDSLSMFILGGTAATLAGITIGIPDFAWPGWWIWVLVGVTLTHAPGSRGRLA